MSLFENNYVLSDTCQYFVNADGGKYLRLFLMACLLGKNVKEKYFRMSAEIFTQYAKYSVYPFLCLSISLSLVVQYDRPKLSEADSPIIEFGHVHCCKEGCQSKIKKRMANSADPNQIAHYDPSHQKSALVLRAERINSISRHILSHLSVIR